MSHKHSIEKDKAECFLWKIEDRVGANLGGSNVVVLKHTYSSVHFFMRFSTSACAIVHVSCNEFAIALSFVDDVVSALESIPVADLALKEKLPLNQHEHNASL